MTFPMRAPLPLIPADAVGNAALAEQVYGAVMAEVAPGLDVEVISSPVTGPGGAVTHTVAFLPEDDAETERLVLFSSGIGCGVARDAPVLVEAVRQGSGIVQIEPWGHSPFSSPFTARQPETRHTRAMTAAYHGVLARGLLPILHRRPALRDRPVHQLGLSMGGGTVVDHNRRFPARVGLDERQDQAIASTVLISPRLALGQKYAAMLRPLPPVVLRFLLWLSRGRLEPGLQKLLKQGPLRHCTPGIARGGAEDQRLRQAMADGLLARTIPLPYLTTVFAHDTEVARALAVGAALGTLDFPRTLWALYGGDTEVDAVRAGELALLIGGADSRVMPIERHNPLIAGDTLPQLLGAIHAFMDGQPSPSALPLSQATLAEVLANPHSSDHARSPTPTPSSPPWLREIYHFDDGLEATLILDPEGDPMLGDHVFTLAGQPLALLPGVAFLHMAVAVAEGLAAGPPSGLSLRCVKDLQFQRALFVPAGQTRPARLRLTYDRAGDPSAPAFLAEAVLRATGQDGHEKDYSRATLLFTPTTAGPEVLNERERVLSTTVADDVVPASAFYHPRAYANRGVMAMVAAVEQGGASATMPLGFVRARLSQHVLTLASGHTLAGRAGLPLALDMVFQAVEVARVAGQLDGAEGLAGLDIPSGVREIDYYRPPSPADLDYLTALVIPNAPDQPDDYDFVIYQQATGEVFARGRGLKTVRWDRWKNDAVMRPTAAQFLNRDP
jgi:hypothetical protein